MQDAFFESQVRSLVAEFGRAAQRHNLPMDVAICAAADFIASAAAILEFNPDVDHCPFELRIDSVVERARLRYPEIKQEYLLLKAKRQAGKG